MYPKLYIIPLLSGSSCDPCVLNIVKVIWLVTVKTSFIFQIVFQLHNLRRSMLVILWLLRWSFAQKEIGWPKYYILLCHFWEQKTCFSNVKEAVEMQPKACARQKQTQKCQLELKMLKWTRSCIFQKFICISASVNSEVLKQEEAATGGVQ